MNEIRNFQILSFFSEIHYWGLSLLFYLISKKKLSRTIVPVLASVIVQSVRQYSEDVEMRMKVGQTSSLRESELFK